MNEICPAQNLVVGDVIDTGVHRGKVTFKDKHGWWQTRFVVKTGEGEIEYTVPNRQQILVTFGAELVVPEGSDGA